MTAEFDFSWVNMTDDALADFEALLGRRAVKVAGVYWRQVRPGFYRPLQPFKELEPATVILPRLAWLGAAQYAVPPGTAANSSLNGLFFQNTSLYSLMSLDSKRHRQVRVALRTFVIRPVTDLDEFKRKGHEAYLSFYERTRYSYGSKRQDAAYFSAWAEVLFGMPNILVLGAYQGDHLVGISVSYLIDETVSFAMFFCTTAAMKLFVSDLMLHAIRSAAARDPQVKQIFAGMYKGNPGLDGFYLLRGAKCIQKPASLRINPLVSVALRYGAQEMYSKILGQIEGKPTPHSASTDKKV